MPSKALFALVWVKFAQSFGGHLSALWLQTLSALFFSLKMLKKVGCRRRGMVRRFAFCFKSVTISALLIKRTPVSLLIGLQDTNGHLVTFFSLKETKEPGGQQENLPTSIP